MSDGMVFKMDRDPAEIVAGCGGEIYNVFNRLNSLLTKLELALCVFPAGEKAREHRHDWTEEYYIIISGCGDIILGGESQSVSAGDAIAIPVRAWHRMINTGDEELVFWSVNSCPYDEHDIHYR